MSNDPTQELLAEMAKYGLDPGPFEWDGELYRFPGAGKGKRNDAGWLRPFADRFGAVFGDYSQGLDGDHAITWQLNNGKKPDDLDPEEWARMKREMAERQEAREIEKAAEQEMVAEDCRQRWDKAGKPDPAHGYLQRQGIDKDLYAIKQDGDELLISMKALESNEIVSLQRILPDGRKRFAKGGRTKGTRTTIAPKVFKKDKTTPLYICEGWATGWAIHHVTGSAVVVAFTAGNLKDVAVHHRQKFPKAEIVIAADNDRWTETPRDGKKVPNPGFVFAFEAAKAAKAKLAAPDFASLDDEPTDFHDLWQREGEDAVRKWLDPAMVEEVSTHPREEETQADQTTGPGKDPAAEEELEEAEDEGEDDVRWYETAPFRCLGYDHGSYYYLPRESGQIQVLSASGHDRKTLLPLAPLTWWEQQFPQKKNSVDWTMAADALIRAAHSAGVFRPEKLRGRGCWPEPNEDGERGILVHLGDRLLAPDAKSFVQPEEYRSPSRYIYERQHELTGPSMHPLNVVEAQAILDTFESLAWREAASAYLAAGWTVLAPVCGALEWRPHIWLTGERGCGKSTVLEQLITPLLADLVLPVQGQTTEAGIRQELRADALAVIFDEAEEDETAGRRIQAVLALARQASSESVARTLKGTPSGDALQFRIRSMFCLASIGGALHQEADRSRVSLLALRGASQVSRDEREKHWAALVPKLEAVTEETGRRLIARTLRLLRAGMLHETVKVFRRVAATLLGEARHGDQFGTLYAGAWTLMADEPPTESDARELLETHELESYQEDQQPDGKKVLGKLMQQRERVETNNGTKTLSIGELIDMCCGTVGQASFDEADSHLRQLGLRVVRKEDAFFLHVSNQSEWIQEALEGTIYARGIRNVLRGLDGVEASEIRFHSGFKSRTSLVPTGLLE